MESKSLSAEYIKKVLFTGGLQDIDGITHGDIEGLLNSAGALLRAHCTAKNAF